jgi:hypothetical protein
MDKFNSFEELGKLRDKFPCKNTDDTFEGQKVIVGTNKEGDEPIIIDNKKQYKNTEPAEIMSHSKLEKVMEKSQKPEIGMIITSISGEEKIAFWKNEKGSYFIKIMPPNEKRKDWKAVENPGYSGKGLIVFIDKEPNKGDSIKIEKVSSSSAVGIVISK